MAKMKLQSLSWGEIVFPQHSKLFCSMWLLPGKTSLYSVTQTASLTAPFCLDRPVCMFRLQDTPLIQLRTVNWEQQGPPEKRVVLPIHYNSHKLAPPGTTCILQLCSRLAQRDAQCDVSSAAIHQWATRRGQVPSATWSTSALLPGCLTPPLRTPQLCSHSCEGTQCSFILLWDGSISARI